jgi:imidazoleglycerol-phosphate dehydratase
MRTASLARKTAETDVAVEVNLDGSGKSAISTGIGMLDHLLDQLARHGILDITIRATGDLSVDYHHTVEDTAIVVGRAFDQALGDRAGIVRMGHAIVPLDETLALVALDLSGRGYAVIDEGFNGPIGQLPAELVGHFLETFAREGRLNLHVQLLRGQNGHHQAEAVFKALARSLDMACREDPRRAGSVPSTKGTL